MSPVTQPPVPSGPAAEGRELASEGKVDRQLPLCSPASSVPFTFLVRYPGRTWGSKGEGRAMGVGKGGRKESKGSPW